MHSSEAFPRTSILVAVVISMLLGVGSRAEALPVIFPIVGLEGIVEPVTYRTGAGAFMTGPIALSLDHSSQSFIVVDQIADTVKAHTAMLVSFNDGRGSDLSGSLIVDESGSLSEQSTTVTGGTLSGAEEFAGTRVRGRNPFRVEFDEELGIPILVIWESSPPPPPPPHLQRLLCFCPRHSSTPG